MDGGACNTRDVLKTVYGGNGSNEGGAGGDGNRYSWESKYKASGGAGNPGGAGKAYSTYDGQNGTGGLLTIYANTLINNSKIEANGSNGGQQGEKGGGSGGGSINIFYKELIEKGTITALGGNYGGSGCVSTGDISTGTYEEYVAPPTVSDPNTSTEIRTANKLPFTWKELGKIAEMISNNSDTITNDTSELTVTYKNATYTIGVGDYTTINGKEVRIMGFNHDILSGYNEAEDGTITYSNIYGGQNKYAGISFEYVDFIINSSTMSNTNTNSGGWADTTIRITLNTTQYDNLPSDVKGVIKQVKKPYCAVYNSSILSYSDDYLWLLSCAEIWNSPLYSGCAVGTAKGREGSRYKYYAIINASCRENNYTKKPSTFAGSSSDGDTWWLRSPHYEYSEYFCKVRWDGGCDYSPANNGYYYGIAPGFSI